MTPRTYQEPAIETLSRTKRGVLRAPAGAGKTYIACAALDRALSRRKGANARVLWLAHTHELLDQAKGTMSRFPAIAERAEVTFLCPQSYRGCEYDLVIVDECHRAACDTYAAPIESAGARWGITATPDRPDDLAPLVFERIGPIVHEIPRAEVLAAGGITHGRVVWHRTGDMMRLKVDDKAEDEFARQWRRVPPWAKSEQKAKEMRSRCLWTCVLEAIEADAGALQTLHRLCKHALAEGRQTLVICRTIEAANTWAGMYPGDAVALHAKLAKRKREAVIADVRCQKYGLVFASSLVEEGFDAPSLAQIIMQAPSRSARATEQRTGRVLRAFAEKAEGIIHDFCGEAHPMLMAQAKARAKVYRQLGYAVDMGRL